MPKKPPLPKQTGKPPLPPKTNTFIAPWESGIPRPVYEADEDLDPDKAYNWNHIPERTKAIRRLFVTEYVKDFNGSAAVMRLGFIQHAQPQNTAYVWLKEAYTQYLLDKYLEECEEKAIVSRNKVMAGLLREANAYGLDSSGASRVSAYGKLAKICGFEITKIEANVNVGGTMLVPLAADESEWETMAKNSQTALIKHGKSKAK